MRESRTVKTGVHRQVQTSPGSKPRVGSPSDVTTWARVRADRERIRNIVHPSAISTPGDPHEAEADRVAEQVMRMGTPAPTDATPATQHGRSASDAAVQ